MQIRICLAKKMGERLGKCYLLQQQMQAKKINYFLDSIHSFI